MNELRWFVAHTKPRREKKLKRLCENLGLLVTLPCSRVTHEYQRKTATFEKPVFSGYVFFRLSPNQIETVRRNKDVANFLTVEDQELFGRQLGDVLKAITAGLEMHVAEPTNAGLRVRVKSGPLEGMEGVGEDILGAGGMLLRLDAIGQAIAVKIPADDLERV